ncbi:barstar family protein [Streptomyces sp. NPDC002143]
MTSTMAWICPLTEAAAGIPTRRDIRGSHCRTRQGLFTEWAAGLGFPDHFGHNWDAFRDCVRDAVSNVRIEAVGQETLQPLSVVVREAGDLLGDEPQNVLAILLNILGDCAGDTGAAPRLRLFLEDTPDRLFLLAERMAEAGYTLASPGACH